MSRSDAPDPKHGVTAFFNVFIGGVVGALANVAGRAWLNGNTFIASFAGLAALAFVALVILTQVSDWAYWRGEKPEILDPKKRATMSWFRLFSLPIGLVAGLVLAYLWVPNMIAGQP